MKGKKGWIRFIQGKSHKIVKIVKNFFDDMKTLWHVIDYVIIPLIFFTTGNYLHCLIISVGMLIILNAFWFLNWFYRNKLTYKRIFIKYPIYLTTVCFFPFTFTNLLIFLGIIYTIKRVVVIKHYFSFV